jgi:hypothetical protein
VNRASPGTLCALLGALSVLPGPLWSAEVPAPQSGEGGKLALIIAISDYGEPGPNPLTGEPMRRYRTLNAKNDVPLIRGVLEVQGFLDEDIRVIQDAEADAEGIRAAFRWLRREADEGDVVVLHYSGHGHRMSNDNPEEDEETDGYDELLVPYGAHDEFYEGYDGSLHIRDDEVGELLAELRRRVGPTGNVTFFIDACHSGTATRGGEELAARGSDRPLGEPNGGVGDLSDVGTGLEMGPAPATRGSGDDALAPYAVFSAASQRQVAYETFDVDGKTRVGSLSYALARTLPKASPGTTYRALFADITRTLSGKVRQTPQVEGTIDAQLFSNRLSPQTPYVEIDTVVADLGLVALGGGSLMGLNPGTRLLVHPAGATRPDPETALATLAVVESEPLEAIAEVVEGTLGDDDLGAWAFVTQRTFGDLATRVQLDPGLRESDREGLERVLGELGIIEFVPGTADVYISPGDGLVTAFTVADSMVLARGAVDVVRVVENFARNQYLRRLDFESDDIRASLDIAPAELERDRLRRITGCSEPDWEGAMKSAKHLGGGQWRMALGDAYHLRVTNTGARRAFVALLDLMPRGDIKVLRPREDEPASSYELEPGATMDLGCFLLDEETGFETLKLFATAEPQEFRAMFETRGTRGSGGEGDLSALEQVMSRSFSDTRSGNVGAPGGLATTVAIHIHVIEGR